MTSEDVILIIDEICDKCGIAVNSISEIIPAFTSYKIAGYLSGAVIAFILGVIVGIACYFLYKKEKAENIKLYEEFKEKNCDLPSEYKFAIYEDGSGMLECLFSFFIVYMLMGGTFLICSIPTLAQWIISPEAAFIVYILSFI